MFSLSPERTRCSKCHGQHHVLLCDPHGSNKTQISELPLNSNADKLDPSNSGSDISQTDNNRSQQPSMVSLSHVKSKVLLQAAQVPVLSVTSRIVAVTVLFDTGSNPTYIRSEFVQKVKSERIGPEPVMQHLVTVTPVQVLWETYSMWKWNALILLTGPSLQRRLPSSVPRCIIRKCSTRFHWISMESPWLLAMTQVIWQV